MARMMGGGGGPNSSLTAIYAQLLPALLNILANPAMFLDSTDQTLQLLSRLIGTGGGSVGNGLSASLSNGIVFTLDGLCKYTYI